VYVVLILTNSLADIAIAIYATNYINVLAELIGAIIYLVLMPFGDFFGRHYSLYLAFK